MSVKGLPSVAVANYGYYYDQGYSGPFLILGIGFIPLVVDQSYAKTSCHLPGAALS